MTGLTEGVRRRYLAAIAGIVGTVARHARVVLTITVLLTAVAAYYTVNNLAINTNTEGMLSPNLPFRQLERQFDAAFPNLGGSIVLVIDGSSPARAEDVANKLTSEIRANHKLIESVYQPGGGPFFARNGLLYLDKSELWNLDEQLAEAEPFLGTMAQDPSLRGLFKMLGRALDEKLSPENQKVLGRMLNRMSTVIEAEAAGKPGSMDWRDAWLEGARPKGESDRHFVLIDPREDYAEMEPAAAALKFIRKLVKNPAFVQEGVRVRITGNAAMENEELANVSEDGKVATILSFTLVCLILLIGLRSPKLAAAILFTLCVGLIWTAAFAAYTFGSLNLISISFAVLFIGMGVDFGIQFGMRYKEELYKSGERHLAALDSATRGVGGALTLAATAAAISFFAFAPTSYRGLAELGVIAGASMVVALIANLTVLPAVLTLVRLKSGVVTAGWNPLSPVGPVLVRFRRVILVIGGAAAIGALALLPDLHFDFNPLNLRDPTTEAVATFRDLLKHSKTSPYTIEVLTPSLDAAKKLAARLDKLDVVDKTVTLASYVPDNQAAKLDIIQDMQISLEPLLTTGETVAAPSVAENVAAFKKFRDKLQHYQGNGMEQSFSDSVQRLRQAMDSLAASPLWPDKAIKQLQPRVVGDFPKILTRIRDLLQAHKITLQNLPHDLRDRYITPNGRARVEVFPKQNLSNNVALRHFVSAVRTVAPNATDAPVSLVEGGDAVINACTEATALALGATALLMLVLLRSLYGVALVLLPMLLAITLTMGSSVLFGLPLNFANIIALPLLIGLSNAFGIYLMLRRRDSGDVPTLFRSSTPSAILFSGLTTMVSFGSLAIARHPGMSNMGILISFALGYALLSSLVVLPAVLAEVDAHRRRKGASR